MYVTVGTRERHLPSEAARRVRVGSAQDKQPGRSLFTKSGYARFARCVRSAWRTACHDNAPLSVKDSVDYCVILGAGEVVNQLRMLVSSADDKACQHGQTKNRVLVDCPAFSFVRARHASLFQQVSAVSDLFAKCEANGGYCQVLLSLSSTLTN